MSINRNKFQGRALARRIIGKCLATLAFLATSSFAFAQEKDHDRKEEIKFSTSERQESTQARR